MRRALIVLLAVATAVYVAPALGATQPSNQAEVSGKREGEAKRGGKQKRQRGACPPRSAKPKRSKSERKGSSKRASSAGKKGKKRQKGLVLYCSSSGQARADFNGDGIGDLAVGVPFETVAGQDNAGAVNVIYGSASGLTATGNQLWNQESPGILQTANHQDQFGAALAAGDFNGDGFADLAVGAPNEDISGIADAGAVNVIYGSSAGLSATANQLWHQDSAGIEDVAEPSDRFGSALGWANFAFGPQADLAVGVRHEDVAGQANAGAVNVIYGLDSGLSPSSDQLWTQDSPGVPGEPVAGDQFGTSLTGGDFDGNGFADLAAGAPNDDPIAIANVGAVNVIYGMAFGLVAGDAAAAFAVPGSQLLNQASPGPSGADGVADTPEPGDGFGTALTAGDFDGDKLADLAVGAPGESLGSIVSAGAVNVIYGSGTGVRPDPARLGQFFNQDSPGVPNDAFSGDLFGIALAAGDFDANGRADLAVGVPFTNDATGAVTAIYGSPGQLGTSSGQYWTQNFPGVPDDAEAGDRFGAALSPWNFGHGLAGDLAIGVPGEAIGPNAGAGAVNVLYGSSAGGLTATASQFWHQNVPGILGAAAIGDGYGAAVY